MLCNIRGLDFSVLKALKCSQNLIIKSKCFSNLNDITIITFNFIYATQVSICYAYFYLNILLSDYLDYKLSEFIFLLYTLICFTTSLVRICILV